MTFNINKCIVYDIETLSNCFIVCFKNLETNDKKSFIFFNDDEYLSQPSLLNNFLVRCKKNDYTLVGFNNIGFDAQVTDHFLEDYKLNKDSYDIDDFIKSIYGKAQEIITTQDDENRFDFVKPAHKLFNYNLDLRKQKHYDGMAKRGTSLKWLQFSMRFPNIQEMPIDHTDIIQKEQIEEILSYCWNDVDSTAEFFTKIKYETELRESLSKEFDIDLLNASEPKISKDVFGKFLSEEMNISYKELKQLRTMRGLIKFKDLIFPYTKFYTPLFNDILDKVNAASVNAAPNSKDTFKYSFVYKDVPIDLGLGGIHGAIKSGVYTNNEEYMILDIDGKSYYPNLAIKNGLEPAHFSKYKKEGDLKESVFLKVYERIYNDRIAFDKKDPRNYVYKIILNSTYGLSKEINSYLYDPLFTYSVTINGQLTLLMLTEMLCEYVKDCQLLQLNTDGITIKFKRKDYERVKKIMKRFEEITKQILETVEYSKMILRDVNNYISIPIEGTPKYKGCFELELDFHKNASAMVVPMAVNEYFVNGKDYKSFIENHNDIYDFCIGVKAKSNFKLNLYDINGSFLEKKPQQKVTRFYISQKGGYMFKDFNDGRVISVMAKKKVTPVNTIETDDASQYDIDKAFYIQKTKELIESVQGIGELTLF